MSLNFYHNKPNRRSNEIQINRRKNNQDPWTNQTNRSAIEKT